MLLFLPRQSEPRSDPRLCTVGNIIQALRGGKPFLAKRTTSMGKQRRKLQCLPGKKRNDLDTHTHKLQASHNSQTKKGEGEMRVPKGLLTIELEEREVFWKGEWHLFPPFFASCVRQSQTCKPPFTTTVNKEQHPSSNKASPFSLPLPQTSLLSSLLLLLLLIAIFHLAARRTEASTPLPCCRRGREKRP